MLKILIFVLPVIVPLLLVRFFTAGTKRERLAVILAWLFPGLGHVYLGHRTRGLVLGALLVATFFGGMVLADFRNVSPLDRHPIWGIAQGFGGLLTVLTAVATNGLMIEGDRPFYSVGCLYTGVACLLNILLMIDAFDIGERDTARRKVATGGIEA